MHLKNSVRMISGLTISIFSFTLLSTSVLSCGKSKSGSSLISPEARPLPNPVNPDNPEEPVIPPQTPSTLVTNIDKQNFCAADFCLYDGILNQTSTMKVQFASSNGLITHFDVSLYQNAGQEWSLDASQCQDTISTSCDVLLSYTSLKGAAKKGDVTLYYSFTNSLGENIKAQQIKFNFEKVSALSEANQSPEFIRTESTNVFTFAPSNKTIISTKKNNAFIYDSASKETYSFKNLINTISQDSSIAHTFSLGKNSIYACSQHGSIYSINFNDLKVNSLSNEIPENFQSNTDCQVDTSSAQETVYSLFTKTDQKIYLCATALNKNQFCLDSNVATINNQTSTIASNGSLYVAEYVEEINGSTIKINSYTPSFNTNNEITGITQTLINVIQGEPLPPVFKKAILMAFNTKNNTLYLITLTNSTSDQYQLNAINISNGNARIVYTFSAHEKVSAPFITNNGSVVLVSSDNIENKIYGFSKNNDEQVFESGYYLNLASAPILNQVALTQSKDLFIPLENNLMKTLSLNW